MNVKKLPKAVYVTIIKCPECGWHGNNSDDVSATLHEMIETKETDKGVEYFHCTACGCDFRE